MVSKTSPSEGAGDKMTSSPCHCCYILNHLAEGKTKPSIKLKSTLPPPRVWAAQVPAHIAAFVALPSLQRCPGLQGQAPDKTLGSAPPRLLLGEVIWNIFLNNRDVRKIVKLRSAWGSPLLGWAPAVCSGGTGAGQAGQRLWPAAREPWQSCLPPCFAPDHASLLQLPPNVFIKLQGWLLRLALAWLPCSLI